VFVVVDLLFRDYNTDQKFTLTTYSPTGVVSFFFYNFFFFCGVIYLFAIYCWICVCYLG
jgi:hypothetical protein